MEPTSEESSQAKARLDKANQVIAESEQAKEIAPFVHQCPAHEFAKLLATFRPGSEAYHLTTLAWQQQMTDRQISASNRTAKRAALWGFFAGITGILLGVFLAWLLSGEQPPLLHKRSSVSLQAQGPLVSQSNNQQPTATNPTPPAQASPTLVKQATPNP